MKRLLYPALLGLALAGCAQADQEDRAADYSSAETAASAEAPAAPAGPESAYAGPVAANATPAATAGLTRFQTGHRVIYHGEMSLGVENFEQTTARLDQLLADYEAVLGTANETRANGQHRQELTLKVRPEKFLPLVSALGKLGRIDSKTISSSDVTADVLAAANTARTRQAAAAQARQQAAKAATPGRADELSAEARQLSTEAEAAQARVQALSQQSAWATLTLRLYQPLPEEEITEPLPAYGPRFAAAFLRGGSIFLNVLVGLTNLWPLLTLAGLGYWALRRWRPRQPAS